MFLSHWFHILFTFKKRLSHKEFSDLMLISPAQFLPSYHRYMIIHYHELNKYLCVHVFAMVLWVFNILKKRFIFYCTFYSRSSFYVDIFILLHRALDPSLLYSPCSVHVEFLLRITDTTVHTVWVTFLSLRQHTRTKQLQGWRMCVGSWFQRVPGHHSRAADMTEWHCVVAEVYGTGFSTWHRQEADSLRWSQGQA